MHPLQQLYHSPLIDPSRLTLDLASLLNDMPAVMAAYDAIKAGLEKARGDKVLGQSLQSSVVLDVPDTVTQELLNRYAHELDSIFVVSSVVVRGDGTLVGDAPAWKYVEEFEYNGAKSTATVLPPSQAKCPRCWRYVAPVEDQLCGRCETMVKKFPGGV